MAKLEEITRGSARRSEIKQVPAVIRSRDRAIGRGESALFRYERATFDQGLISITGKPLAAFVCPSANLHYVRRPFAIEPDFKATSVNYDLAALLAQGPNPA